MTFVLIRASGYWKKKSVSGSKRDLLRNTGNLFYRLQKLMRLVMPVVCLALPIELSSAITVPEEPTARDAAEATVPLPEPMSRIFSPFEIIPAILTIGCIIILLLPGQRSFDIQH